ncbi:hypothetical protein [Dyella sp. 2RAB6]|uniref:hypothetical protein n=1 Tax=Dyella sp. 2RAB6 TaxID=3232992 RepID=UPI003F91F336
MDTVLAMVVVALCAFFVYDIGLLLNSKSALMVAFCGCTIAMAMELFVMFKQCREKRS